MRSQLSTSHSGVSIKAPPFRATTARSADGSAEPLWQPAEQILLIFTDPRHVTVPSLEPPVTTRGGLVGKVSGVSDRILTIELQ